MHKPLDPLWTPTGTATTNSSRSNRRRPRRPTSTANTPTKSPGSPSALARSASAPGARSRSATPSVYPRPSTPKPAHKPYRHMERDIKEAYLTPERSGSSNKHKRHKSYSSVEAIPMKQFRMDRSAMKHVVSRVSEVFNHFPFVLSGLSAMVYWGYDGRRSANVTIICPASSREAIRGWAKAKGLQRFPDKPDQFGIETSKGVFHTLRVKYMDEGFDQLHVLRSESMKSAVLSLAGLANQLADGYVRELAVASGARQEAFATDMIWVLKRIISVKRKEHWLSPQRSPRIWDDNFWEPFTLSFPDSVPLFGEAGFRVYAAGELPPWDTREEVLYEQDKTPSPERHRRRRTLDLSHSPSPQRHRRRRTLDLTQLNIHALNEEQMRF